MAILSVVALAPAQGDPNDSVWLFYLGFVLLVGGCCAYLAALFSFGGIARNFGALVAAGLYMFLIGSAMVAAVWIWGLQDPFVKENNAFLGLQFAGLAVLLVGAGLIIFSRLLPANVRMPLPDILTPGLFAILAFVPTLVLAFVLLAFNAAIVSLIRGPLPASTQVVIIDDVLPIGPIIIVGLVTLLVVLLMRGVYAPLTVKALAVGVAAIVTVALFLRGPSDWSEPPLWGFDILLLALGGSLFVYFVSRSLAVQDESAPPRPAPTRPAPTAVEPAPQQTNAGPVTWEEPRAGE
jgi:hypothetical protein